MDAQRQTEQYREDYQRIKAEIARVIVGQEEIVDGALTCLLAGGHALLEGVPGLGKTLLVRTLAQVTSLQFSRIQFTPDLMPADIVGTNVIYEAPDGSKEFRFQPGPIFCNILLADEINRATPKTQSAMLEAMQEQSVTVGGRTHALTQPYVVLATENPIEMEGTYPLPEAQLDRFMFKLIVRYPSAEELNRIVTQTTGVLVEELDRVLDAQRALEMRCLVREIPAAEHVVDYAVRLVMATHPESETATDMVKSHVSYGSSPRGAQALILGAKSRALLAGRFNVAFEDIQAVALPSLRHRLLRNFEGEAMGIATDDIVQDLLKAVPIAAEVKSRNVEISAQ